MNYGALISLIPPLIASGKATEALSDYHVVSTFALPFLADPTLFTDRAKLLVALSAAAKDGRLATANDALYGLATIATNLLKDPNHGPAVMALLNGLVPDNAS